MSKLIPHCAFRVGPYRMALPAPSVLEVLQSAPCTPLARAPAAVLGVINLRGQIVATVDLRRCLGASTEQPLDQTMSIVVTVVKYAYLNYLYKFILVRKAHRELV